MADDHIYAAMIEASARSDAAFDGRDFDRLSRADRERYLARSRLSIIAAEREMMRPRPLSEWHEDIGDVLWWRFPIVEPPYAGSPLDLGCPLEITVCSHNAEKTSTFNVGGWPGYHTHWTPISVPFLPASPVSCVPSNACETGESDG